MATDYFDLYKIKQVPKKTIERMVADALAEDIAYDDITSQLVAEKKRFSVCLIVREPAVICGCEWVKEVFNQIDSASVHLQWFVNDGALVSPEDMLLKASGSARSILKAERAAINFLQMLSGVATNTHLYAQKLAGTKAKILDTRKTVPGYRLAQKYAVYCGGGINHRVGLFDAFLIKENHINAIGSITQAVKEARKFNPKKMVEVEVECFEELEEALACQVDVIMLDNFSNNAKKKAVSKVNGRALIEASGEIALSEISAAASTGVDYISSGALTKHVHSIDMSLRYH